MKNDASENARLSRRRPTYIIRVSSVTIVFITYNKHAPPPSVQRTRRLREEGGFGPGAVQRLLPVATTRLDVLPTRGRYARHRRMSAVSSRSREPPPGGDTRHTQRMEPGRPLHLGRSILS